MTRLVHGLVRILSERSDSHSTWTVFQGHRKGMNGVMNSNPGGSRALRSVLCWRSYSPALPEIVLAGWWVRQSTHPVRFYLSGISTSVPSSGSSSRSANYARYWLRLTIEESLLDGSS